MNKDEVLIKIKDNWATLEPYCIAIYKGGSRVDPVINKPHDYDYICFVKQLQRNFLASELNKLGLSPRGSNKHKLRANKSPLDFSQFRTYPYNQITWFSYLDILMEPVFGENICPKTDIIKTHRKEFIKALSDKANELVTGKINNQKRWYHILRGIYILKNNSYEVTDVQREEINILHDLNYGWESIKEKTIKLMIDLK